MSGCTLLGRQRLQCADGFNGAAHERERMRLTRHRVARDARRFNGAAHERERMRSGRVPDGRQMPSGFDGAAHERERMPGDAAGLHVAGRLASMEPPTNVSGCQPRRIKTCASLSQASMEPPTNVSGCSGDAASLGAEASSFNGAAHERERMHNCGRVPE